MPTAVKETVVKGGVIVTENETGRFIEVRTDKGVSKSDPDTRSVLKDISTRRSAALKRLVNR